MKFLSPWSLWLAAALPAVIALYLLKRKRIVRIVPSTVLWERFLAETQASAPFQRLRQSLLLWLQLILLALAVLAVGRPYFSGLLGEAGLDVIVLDASASMQATDEKPSRFDRAKSEALELINSIGGLRGERRQALVIVAAGSTDVRQSATSDRALLRQAISSAGVTDGPTRLGDALRVADALTRNRAGARVHLFSDGAGVDLSEFESLDLNLIYHKVGLRSQNTGIVSAEVKPDPDDPLRKAVFAGIANFGTNTVDALIELSFEDQVLESKTVRVEPSNNVPVVFVARQNTNGVFTLRLKLDDDLAADNEARLVSELPQPQRVLLVTRGNRFLARSLTAASPLVQLTTATSYDPTTAAQVDTVVLDDATPANWPTGNVLAVHVANTNWLDRGVTRVQAPPIVDWRNTHPLLRFVSFDNVQAAESLVAPAPSWAVPLVDSTRGALIIAGERGRQRIIWIGFDTLNSTWPLRISFPIFIANALDWLNPAARASEQLSIRAGDTFRYTLDDRWGPMPPGSAVEVTAPGGKTVRTPVHERTRELVVAGADRQGVYRASRGTNGLVFAVNLLDGRESNIRPSDALSLGRRGTVVAASGAKPANLERWRWFASGALAVMMFEWWWYHRRTA